MSKLTVEEAINSLHSNSNHLALLKVVFLVSYRIGAGIIGGLPNFTGQLPYQQWSCLHNSTKCLKRVERGGISRDSFCGVKEETPLLPGLDIIWELDGHKTYAVDWDLLCKREYIGTLITSSFYMGGGISLLFASALFDMFGRVKMIRITQTLSTILAFMMMYAPSIWYQLLIRSVFGATSFLSDIGYLIIIVELSPASLRSKAFGATLLLLNFGYLSLVLLAYIFEDRNYIAGISAAIFMMCLYPLYVMIPESPFFLLTNKRDEVATKAALKKLSRFYGEERSFENIEIVEYKGESGNEFKKLNFKDVLNDFTKHPALSIQCCIFVFSWFVYAWIFYGLYYNWGKFGKNIYLNYVLSSCCDIISLLFIYLCLNKCKRRSLAYLDFVTALALIISLAPLNVGNDTISLRQVSSLIGYITNSVVMNINYVWIQELSPTTHRGIIASLSSSSSKVGSMLGPQVGLLFAWNKTATLGIFAGASAVCGVLMLLLPETKGHELPSQAKDVMLRTQQVRRTKKSTKYDNEMISIDKTDG